LNAQPDRLEQARKGVTHIRIVVDDEYDRVFHG
jgi:hypothetical protein